MPNDFLKYFGSGFGRNATTTINFGEFIDSSTIKVNASTDNGTGTTTTNSMLNLKNNTLTYSDGSHSAFIFMTPIPIDYQRMFSSSVVEESVNFNGLSRDAYGMHVHNATTITDFDLDKETGIIVNFAAFHTGELFNKTVTLGISMKLLDTNIITSSSSNPIVDTTSTIPKWVKNNAERWSQGSIDDSDFIKGIQYLIQQGIIKIPDTQRGSSSSNQIPHWIKTDASLWASNQISDDDFIKAIQYLVINGIISP